MEKELRRISLGELKLMFTRLVIKVQEEPEMFKDLEGSGVDTFFDGEDKRRELLVDKFEDIEEEEDTEERMYRLEYNETDGNFHFAYSDAPTEHIHKNWVTICSKLKVEQCQEFTEYFDEELGYGKGEKHSLEIVKREFENWLVN
jgi:hypothetical protein